MLSEIAEQLSDKDKKLFDFFLKGYDNDSLVKEFYIDALKSGNKFIREFFRYDLCLRNSKVKYINRELGRREDMDIMDVECGEIDGLGEIVSVLATKDLLDRERGIDDLMWKKADELTVFETFSMDAVLAFVAKMKIVERWMLLDAGKGKELFRKLVSEIKEAYSI